MKRIVTLTFRAPQTGAVDGEGIELAKSLVGFTGSNLRVKDAWQCDYELEVEPAESGPALADFGSDWGAKIAELLAEDLFNPLLTQAKLVLELDDDPPPAEPFEPAVRLVQASVDGYRAPHLHKLDLAAVAAGTQPVGAATLTILFPVILPWRCCDQASRATCARCETPGFTHGAHHPSTLRCFTCDTEIAGSYKAELWKGAPGE